MRASHSDRERTIDVLKAGFSEGRLGQPEYEQRLSRATQALTYAELNVLIADLPQGPMAMPRPQQQLQPQTQYPPVARTFLPAQPPPRTNGTAIGALVCGILTPVYGLTAIPAVILGHKARAEINKNGEEGAGLATAGLVLGWLAIGFALMLILVVGVASA
ncbi:MULTISPECIES: DUF1707 and DUF4190 domain-containing protein [unclassified Streptomyces]|uniref:DUF1707 and DUF4190 domain-containing protein n=1 Tax=unclassified Streptomyces TaxID=2593676 RepID=UPI002DDABE5A|nr:MULTISPECIES: DUF1707 and DUF4190 domain-containing protein [unclassified Streptomyces]WSA97157.1 DUF1707 and DUF4190 domain-containing protein [Streptomyces sp. NBC_01795]WSB81586.1 DUF1707 and DUF4190 domain-containing protein [Streptomyces sp. NBC_01775]WSS17657.1 DUF1707 and DUF4190 domain-containing protein [Streptomyces sp. NBC_01186]WSS46406.1 DUF1707 and DUF4190 domain-containing protein [Streptomyces sp. NBC_01187]